MHMSIKRYIIIVISIIVLISRFAVHIYAPALAGLQSNIRIIAVFLYHL